MNRQQTPVAPANARGLPLVAALFVTCLVIANIIAVKLVSVGGLCMPAALILFPVSYIIGDILTEVYGYARARQVIWIGFGCNLLAVTAIWLSIAAPPAPFWQLGGFEGPDASQAAYRAIFGFAPRLLAASFAAYLVGEFLNAFVLAKMKIATRGRHLWSRTIGSTLVGQFADSAVFMSVAFYGIVPDGVLGGLMLTQWLAKCAYEAALTPLTYLAVNRLKRLEGQDVFDRGTVFNPFRWAAGPKGRVRDQGLQTKET